MAEKIEVGKNLALVRHKKVTITFAPIWGLLQFLLMQCMSDMNGCDWVEFINEL